MPTPAPILSDRMFGVEIECAINPGHVTRPNAEVRQGPFCQAGFENNEDACERSQGEGRCPDYHDRNQCEQFRGESVSPAPWSGGDMSSSWFPNAGVACSACEHWISPGPRAGCGDCQEMRPQGAGSDRFEVAALCLQEAGLVVHNARGWTNRTASAWTVKSDSSTGSNGVEITSPPLSGADGVRQLEIACRVLHEVLHATTNEHCGLHVHHDVQDYRLPHWKRLAKLYYKHEQTMLPYLQRDRRDNGYAPLFARRVTQYDRYTGSHTYVSEGEVDDFLEGVPNVDSLRAMFSGRRALNFDAFATHGTVEFRQHESTIELDEILNWVSLTQKMVDHAKSARWTTAPECECSIPALAEVCAIPASVVEFFEAKRVRLNA